MTSWRVLVVGVDNAPTGRERLTHAEESALNLAAWFRNHLDLHHCEVRDLTSPGRQQVEDALAWLADSTHRFLIWTGHMERSLSSYYLLTGETTGWKHISRMIPVTSIEQGLASDVAGATTIVAIDACYGGSIQAPKLLDGTAPGVSITLASTLPALPVAHSKDAGLVAVLLSVLGRMSDDALRQGRRTLNLDKACSETYTAMRNSGRTPVLNNQKNNEDEIPIPLAPVRPYSQPPRLSSLQQALGFATRAFRDHLNRSVVSGVDVMYFLGYDPWDGCLVYDGLVPGSVEQVLLDSIRLTFLGRDRLRSRFAEYRASETRQAELGPAGQCFSRALGDFYVHLKSDGPGPTLRARPFAADDAPRVFAGAPWFMADLNESAYENSEFRYYDRLLGLTCCLYLPLVVQDPSNPNRPMGGVIMAASKKKWGLRPLGNAGEEVAKAAEEASSNVPKADRRAAKAIGQMMQLPRFLDGEGQQYDTDDFFRCIAAVHSERTAGRWKIRRALHPVLPKVVLRLLKREDQVIQKQRESVIEAISRKVDDRPDDLLAWFQSLNEHGIDSYIPPDHKSLAASLTQDQCRELVREYLGLCLWREFALRLRDASTPGPERVSLEQHLRATPARFLSGSVVENWLGERSDARRPGIEKSRHYQERGDVQAFLIDTVNDLIDEIRSEHVRVFDMLVQFLDRHGPVARYVQDIVNIQPVLDRDDHQFLDDLAHAVQVYLVGLWLLFARDNDGRTIAMDAATSVSRFFLDNREQLTEIDHLLRRLEQEQLPDVGLIRLKGMPSDDIPADAIDDLAVCWGIVASMHDIGVPVQRFEHWARRFFQRYFDQGADAWSGAARGELSKLLLHPRFPIYKSAIASLHRDRHVRDWLDTLFCRQLTGGVSHSFAGALILANELEPDGVYSVPSSGEQPLWWRIPKRLEDIYGTVGVEHGTNLERELIVPAYLAHAVALGNGVEVATKDPAEDHGRRNYFQDVGSKFRIDFHDFPLTWLLAVCDKLTTPSVDLAEQYGQLGDRVELRDSSSWFDEVGASPFFVRRVEPGPESRSLNLTLEPWSVSAARFAIVDDHPVDIASVLLLSEEWTRLVKEHASAGRAASRNRWVVYAHESYARLKGNQQRREWSEPAADKDERIQVVEDWEMKGEDYSVLMRRRSRWRALPTLDDARIESHVTREYHVRRSVFDLVDVVSRIGSLEEVYGNRSWVVNIQFSNVNDPAKTIIRIGRQKEPRRDAWEDSYGHAQGRLWPDTPTLPQSYRQWVVENASASSLVLDLGCGDGKNLAWFVEKGFNVIGIDGSYSALGKCEQYLKEKGGQYRLFQGDVRALDDTGQGYKQPRGDTRTLREIVNHGDVTTAICIDVLGHQTDPERTLVELHRALARGGVACVSLFDVDDEVRKCDTAGGANMELLEGRDYYYYPDRQHEPTRRYFFRFYERAEAEELVRRAGFKIMDVSKHEWHEPPHPGYRSVDHKHSSWFLTVEKP